MTGIDRVRLRNRRRFHGFEQQSTGIGLRGNDRKFNPALFARLADGNGFALIHRCRALPNRIVVPPPEGSAQSARMMALGRDLCHA